MKRLLSDADLPSQILYRHSLLSLLRTAAICSMLLGIRGSMSRKGNPSDNAKAESFLKALKHEEVLKVDYEDLQDLQRR